MSVAQDADPAICAIACFHKLPQRSCEKQRREANAGSQLRIRKRVTISSNVRGWASCFSLHIDIWIRASRACAAVMVGVSNGRVNAASP